jgi:hypothetical protein
MTEPSDSTRSRRPFAFPSPIPLLQVLEDLEQVHEAQAQINELLSTDDAFAALVGDRPIRFELIDDYGMGAATICRVDEAGALRWM